MKQKILIIGLGLIGGSYAKGLSKKNYEVYGLDLNKNTIDYAKKNNIIIDGKSEIDETFINQFDRIVFCLYPKIFIDFIKKYKLFLQKGSIITDVTGVKCGVVDIIQNELGKDVEFVPSHPMAGREKSGIEFSDDNIFNNANFIITPTKNNTEYGINFVKQLAIDIGFRKISILDIKKHDDMIAFLSQLTHVIAICLMNSNDNDSLVDFTGDSFRDLTRIANINYEMWTELFLMNKNNLLNQIDIFINEINKIKNAISNDDINVLKNMMTISKERRLKFDKNTKME